MKRLFYTSYKHPLTVAIVIIIMGGLFTYSKLQTSLFPEITFPKIKVIADAGQLPVDQMMLTVTRPLELAIKKVPGLEKVRSSTSRGSCEISAFLEWGSDIDISQQRIESKINEIRNNIPGDLQINVERMNPSILPVMGYTLESDSRSPVDLKYLANYTIKPFLSQVGGVSEIRVIGGKEKEYWVELNRTKMTSLGITPNHIRQVLSESDFVKSNGYLNDYRLLYLTVTDALLKSKQDIGNIVLMNDGKRIITLKDLASVEIHEAREYIKINANGREGILIAVVKQPDANLITLSRNIQLQLNILQKTLPADVRIKPYYVQADFVNDSVKSVTDSLWIGLVLAIFVAILFLRSIKASLTILITIPITILLTLIILYVTGQTLNIMTLGAIAASIGLIIDDAIVVMEQIHRTHEENPEEKSSALVHRAIHYLIPAMVGSSLSTIVIFLPFVLMTGVAGAYFKVMTDAMIITLVCSFFVTWILLPVIYLLLNSGKWGQNKSGKRVEGHSLPNQQWVYFFIKRPWISGVFLLVLLLCIVWVFPHLETGFMPEMDEGSIVLDYKTPAGTSLEETDRVFTAGGENTGQDSGSGGIFQAHWNPNGFFITEPNDGDYLIQLRKQRKRTTEEVINDIRTRIESTAPYLEIDFGQVIGDMLGDLMESVQPVEIKIFGNDPKKLESLSREVARLVEKVDGTADVFDGIIMAGPYVNIQPVTSQLARFGISPSDLQYQLQTAQEGNVIGVVKEKEQFTNVRLLYPGSQTINVNAIKNSQLFLPDGQLKSIQHLADISLVSGEAEVQRENLQNMGVVTARLNDRDLGAVMKDLQQIISARVNLPQGYSIVYGGAYQEQQRSFNELLIILILACSLVFCVILVLFREFGIALLILVLAILGISGDYLALYITGTPLNVGSYTGLIMIVGIIGENAIFTFLQFKKSHLQLGVEPSIVYAISTRLRPKLMTALGAIIALLPIALGIGAGAQMHQPLAIAIIGGFLVALPLLLIVLPSMLKILYKHK